MENMAPGYRFYPTEEELITFYLRRKLEGDQREDINRVIPVLDIYEYNPWDLPQVSGEASLRDTEQWFFFIPRQESEARGGRPRRLTTTGYWKATGSPNHVYSSENRVIGMKRTMVFYNGRAPNGRKTDWKMNEYKAIGGQPSSTRPSPLLRQEYSLCRVYKKSKCLRAFDRRPPPMREMDANEGSSSATFHQQVQNPASGSSSRPIGTASSPESSSSGDHGQASHSGEATTGQMDLEDEPLLDWEQIDWFLAKHDSTV
ncbi:NAC domain-containing protein 90-like isoform X2 [Neltuma alba]|uniref:NAC domain-containing protein 90-like isoform X2 n=1 Tax=Neltuma alba TaxID=207710 RepID=UPI0010A4ED1D|nr:NAC domain-containing protein 90-like isoform X2 [Prosopis alba]